MAVNASALVQETTRAERGAMAAAVERRGAESASGGLGFASLLQACSAAETPPPAAPAAGSNLPASGLTGTPGRAVNAAPAGTGQAATQERATERDGPTDAAAEVAASPSPAARDAARAARTPVARPPAAARSAQVATEASSAPAAAQERQTDPAGADAPGSLAQWLLQMGVIPAQGALDAAASGASNAGLGDAHDSAGLAASADAGGAADGASGRAAARAVSGGFRMPSGATDGVTEGAVQLGAQARREADSPDRGPFGAADHRLGELTGEASAGAISVPDGASQAAAADGGANAALEAGGTIELSGSLGAAGLWAAGAAPSSGGAGSASAATGVEVAVQTPFDDPDLPGAVMLQVSQLARDGIGEASLHLNPAEMGPIRVQITLDGQQARIDFAAAHAATRELLEASLPALAQSLSSDGLTLAGSSVSAPLDPDAPAQGRGMEAGGGDASAAFRQSGGRSSDEQRATQPERGRQGAAATGPQTGTTGPAPGTSPRVAPGLALRRLDLYA